MMPCGWDVLRGSQVCVQRVVDVTRVSTLESRLRQEYPGGMPAPATFQGPVPVFLVLRSPLDCQRCLLTAASQTTPVTSEPRQTCPVANSTTLTLDKGKGMSGDVSHRGRWRTQDTQRAQTWAVDLSSHQRCPHSPAFSRWRPLSDCPSGRGCPGSTESSPLG